MSMPPEFTKLQDDMRLKRSMKIEWLISMLVGGARDVELAIERRLHVKCEGRSIKMLSMVMTVIKPSRRDVLDRQGHQHEDMLVPRGDGLDRRPEASSHAYIRGGGNIGAS